VNPIVIAIMLPCVFAYIYIVQYCKYATRDVQRLESVSKTPIFNRISETLAGLQTVRALDLQPFLAEMCFADIDDNQACNLQKLLCSSWLALRLELISDVIAVSFALLSVMPASRLGAGPAFVGIALTYGLDLARYIQALAKSVNDLEQKFTSIQRIFEYCDLTPEADLITPADRLLPAAWPLKGTIEYKDVTMRYRPELDPALRGLTFTVAAGEKLGVVGRTGSGKSSIIVTLLRLTECDSGQVLIDGIDLKTMGFKP